MNDENTPKMRAFVTPFDEEEFNRLNIACQLFSEMDFEEAKRTVRFLKDKFASRKSRPTPEQSQ